MSYGPPGGGYPSYPPNQGQQSFGQNTGTGYPLNPQAAYPPAPGGSPYPPAGGSPYPQPGQCAYPTPGGSPYPPGGGGQYPPAGGSPYPPAGGNPYPPAGGNPYPPAGGNPYPPAGGSPYPPSGGNPYPPAGGGQYPPSGGSPYPPAGGGQYPPAGGNPYSSGSGAYPPAPSSNPYAPPQGQNPYETPGGATNPYQTPGANPYQSSETSSYPSNPGYPPATAQSAPSQESCAPSYAGNELPYNEAPTVHPLAMFDPSSDASALRKAMKGFGTDEGAIINILARRVSMQRQQILLKYQQSYGRDLVKDLKSELSGKFEEVILALMTPLPLYLAKECHDAIIGVGTNERTLVEILCTRDNASINIIKNEYQRLYRKPLIEDIRGDTSGDFMRLLVSMLAAFRDEGPCDPAQAPAIAQQLYQAGEGKTGTSESEFNRILSSYSYSLLRCVFDEYKKIKGKDFGQAIDSELSGDLKTGMKAIYSCIQNRPGFFAKELHDSMSGMGTHDKALIRLVVSRSEIDMGNIKEEYTKMYKKPLEHDIKGDTSGDYKKVLLALVQN